MIQLNEKYRYTALLSIAIIIFSGLLIKEYSDKDAVLSDDQKDMYTIISVYLVFNFILCGLFIYNYNILDDIIKKKDDELSDERAKDTISQLEIMYTIIRITSIPFFMILFYKIINKLKPTLELIPPEFNLNTRFAETQNHYFF